MAYRVILIDDNQNTVRSLQVSVPWQAHGLELAGVAYDGARGCQLIEQLHPDIVITDIRMPERDGLSLIEHEQELLQNARVILITGYDRFQYAAQAIRLSVFDYILKPIDDDELLASLDRACQSLARDRDAETHREQLELYRRRACLLSLLAAPEGAAADGLPGFFAGRPAEYCFAAVLCAGGISQPALQRLHARRAPEGTDVLSAVQGDTLILLFSFYTPLAAWKDAIRAVLAPLQEEQPGCSCAVSRRYQDLTRFGSAFAEAQQALLEQKALAVPESIHFCPDPAESAAHLPVTALQAKCQELADADLPPEDVWQQLAALSQRQLSSLRVLLVLYCMQLLQKRQARGGQAGAPEAEIYSIPALATVDEAQAWFLRFYAGVQTGGAAGDISPLVQRVLDHIVAHATDGLSLESVAQEFHVSPHYLSGLIRKETGITYQQHVIRAKIDVAKKLLDDTRMRIEDIAYTVGYENYISFYNVFKRVEGRTPSEYRLRSRGGKP